MVWREDGWPVMGNAPADQPTGEPVLVHARPLLPATPFASPPFDDAFPGGLPGLQWQWQANPRADWLAPLALGETEGLCLRAAPSASAESLWTTPQLLLQKFPGPAFVAEVELQLEKAAPVGTSAGLIVFGLDYAWIGLRVAEDGHIGLVHARCADADTGAPERACAPIPAPAVAPITLRVEVAEDLACRFFFRASAAQAWVPLGPVCAARSGKWVGAKVGLFCAGAHGAEPGPGARFARFTLRPAARLTAG
jgi:hypothetical protein